MNYTIRDATPADGDVIANFNSLMAEETEGRPLAADVIGPGVMNLLNDSHRGRYWLAVDDEKVIGQIMVTYEWSDWRNGNLWWIQSVYILPEYRRAGVFSTLYHHVEAIARDNGACGLRLYVERNNKRAQQTYAALGMIDPHYQVMEAIFGEDKC